MRRRVLIAACVCLLATGGVIWFSLQAAAESFQTDADVVRLRHLQHYGSLIEEYRQKTGRVPLQDSADVPVYVHVANDQQMPYARQGPPIPHRLMSMAEFVSELEAGLGRTIKERYDPQFRPTSKPNFYIYMVQDRDYFFAVHLHQPFPFAKKIADKYYKAEISSVANGLSDASPPAALFDSPEFAAATNRSLAKRGFFEDRERRYEEFTKRTSP